MVHQVQEGIRAGLLGEVAKTIRLGMYFAVGIAIMWGVADLIGDALGR